MNAFDVVGLLGAVLIVGLFLLLQLGRVGPQSLAYSVWNGIGALLVPGLPCRIFPSYGHCGDSRRGGAGALGGVAFLSARSVH